MKRNTFTSFQWKAVAHSAQGCAPDNHTAPNPPSSRKGKTALLVAALLGIYALAPAAFGADYALGNGAVKFSAPDAWPMLMEKTDGPRQFVALQVKNPGDTNALARITVTAEQVGGLQGFQKFVDDSTARARKLPGYVAASALGGTSSLRYTATENHEKNAYTEVYTYRSNLAIQVRCIRPENAAADWLATFDAGCQSIVSAVGK